jgi:hypothetical protein
MLAEVDRILTGIEANYGLTRREAIGCLQDMASALEGYRPGDSLPVGEFEKTVELSASCFETWALKVGPKVFGWRDHLPEGRDEL